ncbi:MAG TPA: adenylate/guanylate cyclase domain-containing protein, partial [Roseiarcus sp.]|nr:adenylate/guanylate cyclase domain-containing protein [Roseiarcus sp.]
AGADEDRTLSRLRGLRSDLIDPANAAHHGRIVKRTGDGIIIEFRSVVDAVRCAIEVQTGLIDRNAGVQPERRIEFRVGIHLGDVVEESDGDLMGDGVNIAARLEGIAAPGAICLSEDAYRQVKGRLELTVHDLGPTQLKNIAEPIRVYSLEVGKPAQPKPAPAPAPEKSAPPRLSMVVLPFGNICSDPEQEYFVDGVTESLTTDLSRISGAFVIGRSTAFAYKGKAVDHKQIGRELNVCYVLEGSVQRAGNRMRVNVQLIEAETGSHLWAERFDKPIADLFDMQDEIVARLAGTLSAQLVAAEAARAERAATPDSMDHYFQGRAWLNRGFTPDHMTQAHAHFERALALDPGNIDALVGRAYVDTTVVTTSMTNSQAGRLAAAEASLNAVLYRVSDHARARVVLGLIKTHTNRAAEGIREFEQALALDRNMASAHAFIGLAKFFDGRGEETEAHVQEALRLSPRDTDAHIWMTIAGYGKLRPDASDEAAARFRRAIDINRNSHFAHFFLAACLAQLGRLEEARATARAGLTLAPAFTVARFHAMAPSDNPVFLAEHRRCCEGMRKAGVPEE